MGSNMTRFLILQKQTTLNRDVSCVVPNYPGLVKTTDQNFALPVKTGESNAMLNPQTYSGPLQQRKEVEARDSLLGRDITDSKW